MRMTELINRLRRSLDWQPAAMRRRRSGHNNSELLELRSLLSATAVQVRDILPGTASSMAGEFAEVNGVLYFAAADATSGMELWKSAGTAASTVRVRDILPGSGNSAPNSLANVNGTLFFSANDGVNGYELWKSDGTPAGTVLVKDIRSGSSDSNPGQLTNVNGTLYFRANDGVNGYELWKSDGTAAGTVLVKDIQTGPGSSFPRYLTNVNGTLFLRANDGTSGFELWKSNGTSAGTELVHDINPGSGSSSPAALANVSGTLYFAATNGTAGVELWKSGGTASSTTMVRDIATGAADSSPASLTNVNGTLFFAANGGTAGVELWKSSGTSAGTVLVRDIHSGANNSSPTALTNVNGTLYFNATDGTTGSEVWKSDGTAAGTVLTTDLRSAADGSDPRYLTNVAGTLYFSATDGNSGIELWSLRDPQTPVLLNPVSSTAAMRPLFAWNAGSGAVSYEIWIRNDSTGANPFVQATTSTNFWQPTSDLGIGRFTFWVRATTAAGTRTAWSQPWQFTIVTPVTMLPLTGVQSAPRPPLMWNALPGAVRYDVWIDSLSAGQSQYIRNPNVNGTTWTATVDLPMGNYRGWVRGLAADGQAGQWSASTTFTVAPAPVLTAPLNPTFSRRPVFQWNPVAGATQYEVLVRSLATGTTLYYPRNILTTSWTPPADLPAGQYRWWGRALGPNGLPGAWTAAFDFSVGGQTSVLTPTGTGNDTTPTFTWRPVDGAASYRIWVDRMDVPQSKVIYLTGLTATSHTPTTPLSSGRYRVWVQAVSATGVASTWSNTVNFTIAAAAPADSANGPHLLLGLLPAQLSLTGERGNPGEPKSAGGTIAVRAAVDPAATKLSAGTAPVAETAVPRDEQVQDRPTTPPAVLPDAKRPQDSVAVADLWSEMAIL